MKILFASARATYRRNFNPLGRGSRSHPSAGRLVGVLGAFVLLALFSSSAFAQYGSAPAKLTIKSSVLGEDRTILVRTPPGYETNKLAYPVLYMTDGDAHIGHTSSTAMPANNAIFR